MRPLSITTVAWMSPWRQPPHPAYFPSFHAFGEGAAEGVAGISAGCSDAAVTEAGGAGVGAATDARGSAGDGVATTLGAGMLAFTGAEGTATFSGSGVVRFGSESRE